MGITKREVTVHVCENGMSRAISVEQDFDEILRMMDETIACIRTDKQLACAILASTGMYDEKGMLKEEFR